MISTLRTTIAVGLEIILQPREHHFSHPRVHNRLALINISKNSLIYARDNENTTEPFIGKKYAKNLSWEPMLEYTLS